MPRECDTYRRRFVDLRLAFFLLLAALPFFLEVALVLPRAWLFPLPRAEALPRRAVLFFLGAACWGTYLGTGVRAVRVAAMKASL